MSITLGLNTALSGLMTNQRGLDVIAQNVVNVNTKGYVRKVLTLDTRVLGGIGAGVQVGGLSRMVNEGLLKDIRKQTSNMGRLEVEQSYYPRIDDLFGQVGDNTSIAHQIQRLANAFEVLATDSNKPAIQWATMQTGMDVVERFQRMTEGLQGLRLEVDRDIEAAVSDINVRLANIHDLNAKIVKNAAISTGTADLEDKRDMELSELAELIDIQYFRRQDGAMIVYTSGGLQLLDNQPSTLAYSANAVIDSWMSRASGHFSALTIGTDTADAAPSIKSGKLEALISLRDKVIPNMQAELDNLAATMRDELNSAHNRGTVAPAVSSTYTGSRTFANQGTIVTSAVEDTTATIWRNGTQILNAALDDLTFAAADPAYPHLARLTVTNNQFAAASFPVGGTFTVNNAANAANNGTYRIVDWNSNNELVVQKVNPSQSIQLGNGSDVAIATFDRDGNQLQQTMLTTIMGGGTGPWSIDQIGTALQTWLRDPAQGYTNAVAGLDSNGKFHIDLKDSNTSLAFRDQTSSTLGGTTGDATILFDADGDGTTDQTHMGFSNFFGLNDFFVQTGESMILDSRIQSSSFTTTGQRTLRLLDATGQLGNEITIPANSSLTAIAAAINAQTRTTESALQNSTTFTTTSAFTLTVSDASSSRVTLNIPAGPVSLHDLAGQLSANGLTASVVQDGAGYRLRVVDGTGKALSVSATGGQMSANMTLGQKLDLRESPRVTASVVPEGSGFRLRVVHNQGKELFAATDPDGSGTSILTDLGLKRAATTASATLDVRADIKISPERISRGSVQWNADKGQYYISEGDNTTALALARKMTGKLEMDSAGGIYSGRYSFNEYSAASIGLAASAMSHSKQSFEYQKTLNESLDFQYSSLSGVNLDEEVSNMINFQQAYSASAKVITVLQEMLETLINVIR